MWGDTKAAGAEVKPKAPKSVMIYFSPAFHQSQNYLNG
jgi:hypothetical protein